MMEKMAGRSHYCLWATAHPQLADMTSMAAVFPHITGAAQDLGKQGEPALTEYYMHSQPFSMVSGTLLPCLL